MLWNAICLPQLAAASDTCPRGLSTWIAPGDLLLVSRSLRDLPIHAVQTSERSYYVLRKAVAVDTSFDTIMRLSISSNVTALGGAAALLQMGRGACSLTTPPTFHTELSTADMRR